MNRLLYIARYQALAVLLLMLSALAPALAQNVVYQGETSTLGVVQQPGETYDWELYDNGTVNFATVPGNCPVTSATFVGGNIGASVQVQWLKPGTYFFKVNARDVTGCTNNIKVGIMEVKPALPTAVLSLFPDSMCVGDPPADLMVTFTGMAPWNIKLQVKDANGVRIEEHTGIDAASNPFKIRVGPAITTEYTVIEVSNLNGIQKIPSNEVKLTVHLLPEKTPIYLKIP